MKSLGAFGLFVIILWSAPAWTAGPRTDAVAQQLVRTTLPKEKYDEMMKLMGEQVTTMVQTQAASAGQAVSPGMIAKIDTAMKSIYTYEELVEATAAVMVKYYTDDEMRQLLAFYSTPVGKKAILTMPQVMADSMAWSTQKVREAMPRILADLKN